MRRAIIFAAAAIIGFSPGAANAQVAPGAAQCQDQVLQNTLPLLQTASRFSPSGVFPQGYAPLAQPFATNPTETAIWGYPGTAYYASYANPPWARERPHLYPSGFPSASVYPQLFQPEAGVPVPAVDPNPALSSDAILASLQRDGTLDQLTSVERANFMLQLAALQQSEVGQRIAQAGLQQNAQTATINNRRAPFDLSVAYQANSRDWFQSYVLYAATVQNLVAAACNNNTGLLGSGGVAGAGGAAPANGAAAGIPLGNITALSTFCRLTTGNGLSFCNGLR